MRGLKSARAGDSGRVDSGMEMARLALQRYAIYVFLISFASFYYLLNGSILLSHYDLGWHLAAGDLIRDRGEIPVQDPWSFTLGDRQWYNISWLWDVLASILFQHAGFVGLVMLIVVCGAIIVGYLTAACLSIGASEIAVCISVFLVSLLYPSFSTAPNIYLAASPNTLTMLFCVIFYRECLSRTRCLSLPAIMVLWVNLHGGFLLGFLIIGVFFCGALIRRDWVNCKIYGFAGVACVIAIFINPIGWRVYYGVTATLGHFVQEYITEWWSYFGNLIMPGSIPGVIYVLVFLALELRHRSSRDIPEARFLAWLFLLLGFYQFRYMAFFFLFSAVPMSRHVDRLLPKNLVYARVQRALLASGLVGLCALPFTFIQVRPALALPDMLSEQDASYLQKNFSHARVLNHWNVGGLLIFFARGSVPVFVDGRAATAYPDTLLRDYFKLVSREVDEAAWDAVLEKYQIDAVLWVRAHEELRRFLVDKRGWTEKYQGSYESVYARP